MKKMEITTSLLAKICGVSQGTVDRALNNRPGISRETKDKILRTAVHYGYRETISENTEKAFRQIGVIVFDLNNEYFSRLISEIEYVLRAIGYSAVVMMSHYDPQYEIECMRNLYNMGVDGIILCSVNRGKRFSNFLKLFNIPIVSVANRIDAVPYVGTDDFAAMKSMTENVISKGFENIVYFSPAINYSNAYAQFLRYEGFKDGVKGLNYSVVTDIAGIQEEYRGKTAVICSTDYYALQVYFKTKNVTVTGFDNISLLKKCGIKINSVGYSTTEIAKYAVDIILGIRKGDVIIKHYIAEYS